MYLMLVVVALTTLAGAAMLVWNGVRATLEAVVAYEAHQRHILFGVSCSEYLRARCAQEREALCALAVGEERVYEMPRFLLEQYPQLSVMSVVRCRAPMVYEGEVVVTNTEGRVVFKEQVCLVYEAGSARWQLGTFP